MITQPSPPAKEMVSTTSKTVKTMHAAPASLGRLDDLINERCGPLPYQLNLAERDRMREKNLFKDNGTLNEDIFFHNQGLSICTHVGDQDPKWLDSVDLKTLMIIEDFVKLIFQYDTAAWYACKDVHGRQIVKPTILGNICQRYLPSLAHIDLLIFPKTGIIYSNCFYALLHACVQIEFEGMSNFTGVFENPLSPTSKWQVQNALVKYTRTHLQHENSSYTTPLLSV